MGEARQSRWPAGRESHLLRVAQLVSSGEQGQAARGGVSNLSGVQAAARLGVQARLGLVGVWSGGHQERVDLYRPRSLLPALSSEAPLKDWSVPGCARFSPNAPPPWGPSLATCSWIGSGHYLSGTSQLLSAARAQAFQAIRSPYGWS